MPEQKHKNHPNNPEANDSNKGGLSPFVWGLIGAAVGLIGWMLVRLISGMIGG